jgi:hypothetical protein
MLIGKKEAYSFIHGFSVNLVLNKVLELAVQLELEVGPGGDRITVKEARASFP